MQVFKCALRIVKGNLVFPLVYIVGLSFMGVFMALAFSFGNSSQEFQRESYDFAVIDRDGSALSQGIIETLAENGEAVTVTDEKIAIQDAVAKGQTDYLVIIPPGYGNAFIEAARNGESIPTLETVFSYYSMAGSFVDAEVNGFLGLVRSLCAADPTMDLKEAVDGALDLESHESQASLITTASKVTEADRFVFYLQWSTYTLFAGIVVCVGLLISTIGRTDVRRRNLASPLSYLAYNLQLIAACAVIMVFAWVWSFGVGIVAFPAAVAQITPIGLVFCALSMLAYCLVALSFGFLLGSLGASTMMCNAVGNIFGMIISFMGGAWISLDLMSPPVAAAARWLPAYWYSSACRLAAHLDATPTADALIAVGQCLGVLALFAGALFCVAILAGRLRTQTAEAGGNRAAEVPAMG